MASAAVLPSGGAATYGGVTSARGALALLDEEDARLKVAALKQLLACVDQFWVEIIDHVSLIESLSEEETFPSRQLAAAVASKAYYHVEAYDEALNLALGAGEYFNVDAKTEYVEKLIARCIDEYTTLRVRAATTDEDVRIDPRLEDIVDRMFRRCFNDDAYTQAAGIALEARRLDMVEASILKATNVPAMLAYVFDTAVEQVAERKFRADVLRILVALYNRQPNETRDHLALCRCLQFLDDSAAVATALEGLVREGDDTSLLMAYQVGFDVAHNDNQQFMLRVSKALPKRPAAAPAPSDEAKPATSGEEAAADATPDATAESAAADSTEEPAEGELTEEEKAFHDKMDRLRSIVGGALPTEIFLDFLYRHNKADNVILNRIQKAIEGKTAVLHNATVVAHAYMHCGTTCDKFLQNNLAWLGKAANWARFTAVSAQGVVHKGHLTKAMEALEPYLPKEGAVTTSAYVEGGALYALGLIHANRAGDNTEVLSYLGSALQNTQDETIQHGACLGLGLAAMATSHDETFARFRAIVMDEKAVAGEAAGLGIGLLLAGAGPDWQSESTGEGAVQELLTYSKATRHEKITRGLAMAVALMMYGHAEKADGVITQMSGDADAILRYGGMYAIGMAYCGTANNAAIRQLLHVAVSDVSNDVRRAAVTNLGFVLVSKPEQVPRLVALLAESFNPHVRYGACMAVGMTCAGSGMPEAVRLLEPMTEDPEDFVREGALMALAMVLQQVSESRLSHVKVARDKFHTIVTERGHPTMAKMGAILGAGILDAGGRNCVISLRSGAGFTKMSAVIGMALWQQQWYWYPLMHMMSLALTPTAVIGLNADMKMPKGYKVTTRAPPAWFEYPEPLEEKKEEKKERVATAVLSTTAKVAAKQRAKKRAKEEAEGKDGAGAGAGASGEGEGEGDADMSGDKDKPAESGAGAGEGTGEAESKGDGDDKKDDKKPEDKEEEKKKPIVPGPFDTESPARITPMQQRYVSLTSQRYVPVSKRTTNNLGILMLRDTTPGEEAEVVDIVTPPAVTDDEADEPGPPEPFEWTPPS